MKIYYETNSLVSGNRKDIYLHASGTNTTLNAIWSLRNMGAKVINYWFALVSLDLILLLLGGHRHLGLIGCSTTVPASTGTTAAP